MGDFTAFATVTRALTDRLQRVASLRGGAVANTVVQARAPGHDEQRHMPSVTVFLYHVAPNADFRNSDLPTRSADGAVVARPSAAFDLFYLLSFYGADTPQRMETQMLWGLAVTELHANPFITADEIKLAQRALQRSTSETQQALVDAHMLRVTPYGLDTDTLSRLWHSFPQANYTPSMVYKVGPCFLGVDDWPAPALLIQERDIDSAPVVPQPAPAGPAPLAGQLDTPLAIGDTLGLTGVPAGVEHIVVGDITVAGTQGPDGVFRATLSDRKLPVGGRVAVRFGADSTPSRTIDLRPKVEHAPKSVQADKDIRLKVLPVPASGTTVQLLLNAQAGGGGIRVVGRLEPKSNHAEAVFPAASVPPGTYFARVSYLPSDGSGGASESLLDWVPETGGTPAHFTGPVLSVVAPHP